MNRIFVAILQYVLKQLARFTIWRYRPGIIGITGSVGKTSTKVAVAAVLSRERTTRVAKGNLNNEIGLALTVLGDWTHDELWLVSRECPPGAKRIRKLLFWIKVIAMGCARPFFVRASQYPEILVLEYGVDRPGDMRRLLDIARPNIGIMTAIGETPVHVEYFSGQEELVREKARLIESLPTAGFAILNYDDEVVSDLKSRTRAHLMNFGFARGAEMRITNFDYRLENGRPIGISFKLEYAGNHVPVRLHGVFGKAQAYSAAIAGAVGLVFGINLVKTSEALKEYRPPHGRGELVPAVKGAYLIDDTYNASPLSMHAAMDTVKHLPAKRRVGVLGDMLELGSYSMEAHQYLGEIAAKTLDLLVTVGPKAKFIAEGAQAKGMKKKNILSFETAEDAQKPVQELLKKGDLVLLKGSRAMHLEAIVQGIRAF